MAKTVCPSFIGSLDVLQHITVVHNSKSAYRMRQHSIDVSGGCSSVTDPDVEDNSTIISSVSSELAADEKDIVGREVFGFRNKRAVVVKNENVVVVDDDDSLSDKSSVDLSDNNSSTEEVSSVKPKQASSSRSGKCKTNKASRDKSTTETYFDGHKSAVTSDHTLARLKTAHLEYTEMISALREVHFIYTAERKALHATYQKMHTKWLLQMCEHSFNILFHGVGSKRAVLDNLMTSVFDEYSRVVVNGYFPGLTIKSILNVITEDILRHSGSFQNPVEQCEFIRQCFETTDDPMDLFIIIHNIDGVALRSRKTQLVLSMLACVRSIHIVASVDHINAHLLWDQTMMSRFNWLVYDVTTFANYSDETSYENSLLVQQTGSLQLSSLVHVMHSLTQNARGIFLILARYQLDNQDNSAYIGLSFPDLYQKCREAFLVNSDLTLQTQLTEFRDHKLIRIKKGIDGMEYLKIPLETVTLAEFIEQYQENM